MYKAVLYKAVMYKAVMYKAVMYKAVMYKAVYVHYGDMHPCMYSGRSYTNSIIAIVTRNALN